MADTSDLFRQGSFASQYDALIQKQHWHGPEAMLGMMFEYLRPGQKILDLGIGTGLSAAAFHALGLEVHGLDYSAEMLAVCRSKGLAVDLRQFDLNQAPLPYPDGFFDHVNANAVLYFLAELDELFGQVVRIMRPGGIWAFIVEPQEGPSAPPVTAKPVGKNGLVTFRHGRGYIEGLLREHRFKPLKELDFIARNFQMEGKPVTFTVYVAQA